MPNSAAPMLKVSPATSAVGRAHGRVDEVLDREQLVAVRAVAEDRDAPALADPVEQDLEDAEALRADEGLRAQDDDLEPAAGDAPRHALGLDLRLAVVADPDERRVLAQRVVLRDAVDRGRGDQDGAADSRLERRDQRDRGAVDVDRADRLARGLDRQGGCRVDEHVGALDEPGGGGRISNVAAQLLDRRARGRDRRAARRRACAPRGRRRRAAARGAGRGSPRRLRSPSARARR